MKPSFFFKTKRYELLFFCISVIVLLAVLMMTNVTNSVLFKTIDGAFDLSSPNWDQIPGRYVVKTSLSINVLEQYGENCLVRVHAFDTVVNDPLFVKGSELAKKLDYSSSDKTLKLNCNDLKNDKNYLVIWYIINESPTHPTKYRYFITNET